jgi:hypothetical protein
MALADSHRRYLEKWQTKLTRPIPLRFVRNHRPESDLFAAFLESLKELVPQVLVMTEDVPETELPGLVLGEGWRFHAVPEGQKLELLGEIFLALDGQGPALSLAVQSRWEKLPVAPELTIFISPQCPFCPQMVRQLMPLTVTPPKAAITLIDASLFTELSREQEIKAVPTVIVNGVYRLTGAFQLSDLLDLAEKTDPAQLPASVMERMLTEGQAGVLGAFMLEKGLIFPNFLPLLIHPEINIRLGAMVVMETVGEEKPLLTATSLPWIWQEYAKSEMAVQGDIIYLIGEWGDGTWTRPLETALAGALEPELRETLEEALEKIQEKEG